MRNSRYLKALVGSILFCMFIFSVVVTTEAIPDEKEITGYFTNGETIITDSDNILLYYEELWAVGPVQQFDKPYGFRYSFTTSPSCDITVICFDIENLEDWFYGYSHTKYVQDTDATTGSGTFRFKHMENWVIIFWHTDSYQSSTTISYTLSVEKLAPMGLIIGLIIGGIVVVGIVLFAVIGKRRKQKPSYPATYTGPSSGISPGYQTNLEQRLLQQGVVEFQRGNVVGAISVFRQILGINPNSLGAISGLGVAYMVVKDYQQAKYYLERTVAMNPSDQKARELLNLATAMSGPTAVHPTLSAQEPIDIESKVESIVCKNCGSTLDGGDEFCPFCGEAC
ncbi:MAG: tetratricopeptide repeat protein [Asgard group archaeon]|nr:tetratricopeptide repeat protein [Asgard group archaeon]